jgi:hypothetical protein
MAEATFQFPKELLHWLTSCCRIVLSLSSAVRSDAFR